MADLVDRDLFQKKFEAEYFALIERGRGKVNMSLKYCRKQNIKKTTRRDSDERMLCDELTHTTSKVANRRRCSAWKSWRSTENRLRRCSNCGGKSLRPINLKRKVIEKSPTNMVSPL